MRLFEVTATYRFPKKKLADLHEWIVLAEDANAARKAVLPKLKDLDNFYHSGTSRNPRPLTSKMSVKAAGPIIETSAFRSIPNKSVEFYHHESLCGSEVGRGRLSDFPFPKENEE